ncbi:flagellar FliJ family protein [Carboxydothermus pertinax]|uniref:Flagellar FliJ protein n=1 Tax=Carboxydothermus pertinax TaxID=870242 RepID=A0A1L8CUN1_9THEO|nr:flagellar FliJ family protein [Carboxydothermus pertinax]GAV22564.1 flagellar protein [Carboxydothermus pertinax]
MPKFSFRMAKVEKVRAIEADEHKRIFQEKIQAVKRQEEKIKNIDAAISHELKINDLLFREHQLERLEYLATEKWFLEKEKDRLLFEQEKAKEQYIAKKIEHKKLEILRDKAFALYREEVGRKTQAVLDELSLISFQRRKN